MKEKCKKLNSAILNHKNFLTTYRGLITKELIISRLKTTSSVFNLEFNEIKRCKDWNGFNIYEGYNQTCQIYTPFLFSNGEWKTFGFFFSRTQKQNTIFSIR